MYKISNTKNIKILNTYSGMKVFAPLPVFFRFLHICHTWMIQIKLILILHKDNPSKYKMQFWNNDFIY